MRYQLITSSSAVIYIADTYEKAAEYADMADNTNKIGQSIEKPFKIYIQNL